jgi:anti-anti-sigma factor
VTDQSEENVPGDLPDELPDEAALGRVEGARDPSGALVVELQGEIDISNAGAIGTKLAGLLGDAGTNADTHLVIDVSGLVFMDSSGIAMLLQAVRGVQTVAIRKPSAVIRRMIEATGLVAVLPFE